MVSICLYFQVHQPYRLKQYSVFDIGKRSNYFNEGKNRAVLSRVARKCYLPTNKIMLSLLEKHPEFRISYSFSGVILDQFSEYAPEVLESFQELVRTRRVEVLDETYNHSLAFLYSKKEFADQVRLHRRKIRKLFKYSPTVFRNTELIYSNELGKEVERLGYKAVLAEGADHVLGWRSPNFIYSVPGSKMKLLLKNYRLSDDIAFRFSNRGWKEWPLTAEKFGSWVSAINGSGNCVNLFMDYETFGEHQWPETGIFNFLKKMPEELSKHPDNDFKTPSQLVRSYKPVADLDMPYMVSWADLERDLSAWTGNDMQRAALQKLYELEEPIKNSGDKALLKEWRRLQCSDLFYYMCTKWFSDGDVHKYFNPHDSPYEAFITFMNILKDLTQRTAMKVVA
ncbi:glycoside hydrolase family 57 protein [Candidatus Woesearchaeota archaeon]|nr:glycoside hydrolase family 57 protein [Candidatus Woesearchaeota archaeon]